jgi:hemolysin activation/secretion protein
MHKKIQSKSKLNVFIAKAILMGSPCLSCVAVFAQSLPTNPMPDAGRILETIKQVPTPDFSSDSQPQVNVIAPIRPAMTAPVGASFLVNGFKILGNTVLPESDLQSKLSVLIGKKLNLQQLREATEQISNYYRAKGYLIARAYVPSQQISNGIVEVQVIEGRRDKVKLESIGSPIVQSNVQVDFINNAIPQNAVISDFQLERALLLLSDTPGVSDVKGSLEPGAAAGSSDLILTTTSGPRYFGSIDADNFGNRYAGSDRVGVTAGINSITGYGDQLTFRGQTTGTNGMQQAGQTNYGRVAYQLPIGSDGFKLGAAYSAMRYQLGLNYQNTATNGTANTASLFGSYPLVRSRNFNLYGQVGYDNLTMANNSLGFQISNKTVNNSSISLSGNSRDSFLGGGLSTFGASATAGNLGLENTNGYASLDSATAQTAGNFQRFNFNMSRLQAITNSMYFVVNANAQLANKNLDSSQQFYLGGPTGVRAYPVGQGVGSQGALMQLELHQRVLDQTPIGAISAYVFYDIGGVQLFKNTWSNWNQPNPPTGQSLSQNTSLQGAGLGFKAAINERSYLNLTWAHTIGTSQSATVYGMNVNGMNLSNTFWFQGVLQF